jgi:CSLREA domain-containing protein
MKPVIKWTALLFIAGIAIIFTSCTPTPVCAPIYNVTKTADTNDMVCSVRDCSLREAVSNANACPGSQTINLPAGGYTLTIDGDDEDLNQTGDLDITDDLVIIGSGAPSIHGGIERAFHIHNGVTAQFESIWLADGDAILGGGLINEGDLTLISFTCNYNSVAIPPGGMGDARGGCIFNTSSLTVQGGHFLANTAGFGGAIYNRENATAVIEDCSFTGNGSDYHGGGLWNGMDAEMNINNSTLEMNEAGWDGGAVWNHGDLFIEGVSFENNTALGNGGAVFSWTDTNTQFNNSWISGNNATLGGGIYNDNGMMHLYQSGVTSNTANGAVGGGIYNNGPIPTGGLLLENVTISSNEALGGAGGAGIYNTGNFDIRFVTIANNNPGGLRIDTGSEIKIRSSILADNPGGDCAGIAPDSLDYNLESDGTCGFTGPHDLSSTDPLLEPLGSHGSLAPSHPLGTGSPAIDSGSPDLCTAQDQNFTARPQGAGCDRGAFEDNAPGGSISGWTYIDANRNDIRDPEDGFMTGVMVDVHDGSCPPTGTLLDTYESDTDGAFLVQDLPAGTYCLETSPLQETLFPDEIEIVLAAGDVLEDVNFRRLLSPIGDSSLSGLIWHDLCAVPNTTPTAPPPGCIDLPGGGLGADGIYDPAEPGIEGLRVSVYSGACPPMAPGIAGVVLTDASGAYTLPSLTAGTYCVSVDALASPNDTILIPGNWTFPARDADPAYAEVVLGSSENLGGVSFGWDYQFLPEPIPEPASSKGKFNKNAFCRLGPGTVYDTATAFETGTEFEILARSEDHLPLWFYIEELVLKMRCWISATVADYDVEPETLPTRIAPPTPTPVPPTPTPIPCNTSLNNKDCLRAGGTWHDGGISSASYCICSK